jgi:hypothetical protein
MIGFALLSGVMIVGHAASILNFAFPVLAACLAYFLYVYYRSSYVAFTLYIWLFSPLVRRLVDWKTSYHTVSPVMLAPLAVTGIAFAIIMMRPRILLKRRLLPFTLIILMTIIAFAVGVFTNGPFAAAFDWANWLEPIFFGIFLIVDEQGAEENKEALLKVFTYGLIIIGAYGIYQFFSPPAWDSEWLTNSNLHSAGAAVSGQLRIWSTLNSPGTYGVFLMGSLAFIIVARGPAKVVAAGVGFPAFALCEVRTAWGAWAIAVLFIFFRLKGKSRVRLAMFALATAIVVVPILTVGPIANVVSNRFNSLGALQNDRSANAREGLYSTIIPALATNPLGSGFGATGPASKLSAGTGGGIDSGLLLIPLTFGWAGSLVFFWALYAIAMDVLAAYFRIREPTMAASCGTFFGILGAMIFGPVFNGAQGMIGWVAIGLSLSIASSQRRMRQMPTRR